MSVAARACDIAGGMPKRTPPSNARYVALLRGINVSGKNMMPMPRLVAAFEAAGCREVTTFIQSGNVVFSASASVL